MPGMKLLIDTNILLSALLYQNDYQNTLKLFEKADELAVNYHISEFTIYSTCLILMHKKRQHRYEEFIKYIEGKQNIFIENLEPSDLREIFNLKINLDFDDRVQYYLAKKKNLQLVSFDADFDKTDLKRLTPEEALSQLF